MRIFNRGIEKPYCFTCQNTGHVKKDGYTKEACNNCKMMEKLLSANIPFDYWDINEKEFDGHEDDLKAIQFYLNVDVIKILKDQSMGLYLAKSETGIGKTSLAIMLLKYILKETKFTCLFAPFKDVVILLNHYINIYNTTIDEKIDNIKNVDFLVLDDVGKELDLSNKSNLGGMALDSIMRYRVSYKKPTIITSNIELDDLKTTYSEYISILHYVHPVELKGVADHRKVRQAEAVQALSVYEEN